MRGSFGGQMQGVPCHIQVKEGGTRKFSAKNKSGLFPRFCDEHDSRRVSFAQFCFWEDNFWVFCRGLLLGPVRKKRIRKWCFWPSKRPNFSPRPNHGGPRGVQSQGPGAKLKSLIPPPLPTPDPELSHPTPFDRLHVPLLLAGCSGHSR